ncbi:VOC family protein [Streptacidiphilus sp. EB129]|uniref:VOC family protein n=1 Tax=Streptacidiphilus sp. EB129 TaxID=3156262 RepID=UPI0035175A33
MTSLVRNITVDCADAYAVAAFWGAVLDRPVVEDEDPSPGAVELLISTGSGPGLLFLTVPEPKSVKNRLHLDLQPQDRSRDEEVERLLALGATLVGDHRNPDGTGWATMADVEGNEFCVERSAAERAATKGS